METWSLWGWVEESGISKRRGGSKKEEGRAENQGVCRGNGEKGRVRWGAPGQMISPWAEMGSREGRSG